MRPDEEQNFTGTCAANKVQEIKFSEAQNDEAKVQCGNNILKNVFHFKYLGSIFAADGSQKHDVQFVKRRIVMTIN